VVRTRSGITVHHNATIEPGAPIQTLLQGSFASLAIASRCRGPSARKLQGAA
jgi:hypothetical protein